MNRSLTNVLFGGIAAPAQTGFEIEGQITKATVDETVDALANAENVIIVLSSSMLLDTVHSAYVVIGRRVRHGSCKGTVRNIRYSSDAAR